MHLGCYPEYYLAQLSLLFAIVLVVYNITMYVHCACMKLLASSPGPSQLFNVATCNIEKLGTFLSLETFSDDMSHDAASKPRPQLGRAWGRGFEAASCDMSSEKVFGLKVSLTLSDHSMHIIWVQSM